MLEAADSESVDELLEEGNAFEADVVKGVEDAGDAGEEVVTIPCRRRMANFGSRDSLNEKLTQALRTQHLIFPFFDDRKPSQAGAVSADA